LNLTIYDFARSPFTNRNFSDGHELEEMAQYEGHFLPFPLHGRGHRGHLPPCPPV